jgi:pyridoxal phosphate enzyme (YggS family)
MIRENLNRILETIAQAAQKSGRSPGDVKLTAVSKLVDAATIQQAVDCGQLIFGENYLQEAAGKIPLFPPTVQWRFIGHLQSNKAKQAVEFFDAVETVDRLKIARALDYHAVLLHKPLSVLIQVNIGREKQKSGVLPEALEQLARVIGQETRLRIDGLMAMPPWSDDPEQSRPYFRELRQLSKQLADQGLFADNDRIQLSMGMSGDYAVAVEEGATIVRVGTALFGNRNYQGAVE